MKSIKITRTDKGERQTLGQLFVIEDGTPIYSCYTLELPDKGNQKRISCIPAGEYKVKKRFSPKFRNHFHVQNVPNRSYILIHAGNYNYQIQGCVLVGKRLKDINQDGLLDVADSGVAMKELLGLLPEEFTLIIEY